MRGATELVGFLFATLSPDCARLFQSERWGVSDSQCMPEELAGAATEVKTCEKKS